MGMCSMVLRSNNCRKDNLHLQPDSQEPSVHSNYYTSEAVAECDVRDDVSAVADYGVCGDVVPVADYS